MGDALLVCGGHALQDLLKHMRRRRVIKRDPSQRLPQRPTAHIFKDQERCALLAASLKDGNHIGMRNARGTARLAQEFCEIGRVRAALREDFQRDLALKLGIPREIYAPVQTTAELREELKTVELWFGRFIHRVQC